MRACIASYYMGNIEEKTVKLQNEVVKKYNKSNIPHYCMKGQMRHGHFIDFFWKMNGVNTRGMDEVAVPDNLKIDYDVVVFIDIDAIPLHEEAIDYLIDKSEQGIIIGNIQRSGHIDNGNHLFVAPSAMAISRETFRKIGAPSAVETARSDVMEEYTWEAEKVGGIALEYFLPTRFDKPPHRYQWEKDQRPFWTLEHGLPNYGIGTTYGCDGYGDFFYHNFQIREGQHTELFWNHCETELQK